MKKALFILVLLTALSSCKKNILKGNTTAVVQVVEVDSFAIINNALKTFNSGKPVVGAKVYFYGGKTSGSGLWGSSSLKLLETYTTNESGFVYIDFKQKDYKDEGYSFYTLRAYAPNYYVNKTEYDLKLKQDNEITIELRAEAYLRVCVKNISPYDEADRIVVCDSGIPSGGGGIYHGASVDTCQIAKSYGNYTQELCYTVTKNDIVTEYWLEVYSPAHDTTDFYIEY